jgi:hypothetical protein
VSDHTTFDEWAFDEWAIVELFGRERYAGRITEQTIAGQGFMRLDVPAIDGQAAESHLYGPGAVYAIHPTTEAVARAVAARCRPEPVHRWELPAVADQPGVKSGMESGPESDPWEFDDDGDYGLGADDADDEEYEPLDSQTGSEHEGQETP